MCNKENILQGNCNTVITLTIKVFMTSIIKLIMWKFIFYLIYQMELCFMTIFQPKKSTKILIQNSRLFY